MGYKVYSTSYLMSLTKKQLIEILRTAEHNFIGCMYGEEQEEQKDKELEIKIPCKMCYNPHCEQCKYGYKTEEQIKEMIKGEKSNG